MFAIWNRVSEAGSLSDEHIRELREWVQRNRNSELDPVRFFIVEVERAGIDGEITQDAREKMKQALAWMIPQPPRPKEPEVKWAVNYIPPKQFDYMTALLRCGIVTLVVIWLLRLILMATRG